MTTPNEVPRNRLTSTKQALLDRWLRQGTQSVGASISRRDFESEARPLSFAQEQLVFLDQLHPGSGAYNIALAYLLDGKCDLAALESSFKEIARRHETLRTRLGEVDGHGVQLVSPDASVAIDIIGIEAPMERERYTEALRLCSEQAGVPFDLSSAPLLRVRLLRLAERQHVLLIVIHHSVFDGWSADNLEKELFELYGAFVERRPASLPALPIQYGDYAFWQRAHVSGKFLEQQLAYWRQQLENAPPLLELPSDYPRPKMRSFKGARSKRLIANSLVDGIRTVAQSEHATLFMALLAAYSTLLARYCRSDDLVVGSPIAGRIHAEAEHLIGCFINTLALRVDLSGDPTFRELLRRVREVALGAYAHQDLPFEKLVEELKPERSVAYSPLFQVMFSLQNTAHAPLRLPGLQVTRVELDRDTSEFDLNLVATEVPDGLALNAEYNTDLFAGATIERLLAHFETLLVNIIRSPDEKIVRLELLNEAERQASIHRLNETRVDYANGQTVVQLVEARAALKPNMVAIEFRSPLRKKARLTYCELNRRANKLAHHLIGLGVGPDVLVGVCVERSLDMIVALLGILKAGGAYVPLDPSYPSDRLAFMMSDAALSIVVTERASRLPQDNTKLVYVDSDATAGEPEHNPVARAAAHALAYVIYTSGSTGKPKGVMIEHGALANLLHAMREHTAIAEKDWWLAVTTLSFDIAAAELYLPLITGAKLVLVGRETAMDGEALSRCLSNRITLMQATPSTWRLLIEAGWKGSRTLRVLCGGEALSRELADQLLARCASLSNLYGPTETTIWSSAAKIHANRPISIGRPLANTEMYVLDDALNPVPIGVPGELHIGGAGLARGYLNLPELTREKFVANPFHPHTRLYKTGDLVRYRADGEIEFLGRIDHQIKLRGYRIEPGEIEACLTQHAKITEAAVTAREDRPGDRRLVAYVVPRDAKSPPSTSELRQALKTLLPDYMLPSSFVVIDKLPLTPNGKLDRKALPAPDRLDAGTSQVPPRTPAEAQLAAIFAAVLQIKSVGVRDNFFDLGGHSFLVLRVLAEIEKAFGQRLLVATLFQAATVEEIAKILAAENSHESSDVIVPLNPRGTTPPLFSVWMGISTELRDLSRCLGPEQRMYGINSHWDPTKMRMTRIEEMAAYYLTHLRKIQPHGPYYLSSDCVSTLTALEMAQQLSAQGEEVRALILIDPPVPSSGSAPAPGASDRYRDLIMGYRDRIRRFMLSQRNSSRAQQLTALSSRILHALWGILALPVYLALKKPLPRTLLSRYIFDTHLRARDNYVAKDYAGPVWFIWASEEMGDARRRRMQEAWSEIAPRATHYTVPSAHADLFQKPHVALLADKMKLCLDEARASRTPPPRRKAQRRVAGNSLRVSPLAVRVRRR